MKHLNLHLNPLLLLIPFNSLGLKLAGAIDDPQIPHPGLPVKAHFTCDQSSPHFHTLLVTTHSALLPAPLHYCLLRNNETVRIASHSTYNTQTSTIVVRKVMGMHFSTK